MSQPDITSGDIAAVVDALKSNWLSLGPRLRQFEEAFAAYTGTRYAIGVANGTVGLHAVIRAAGIRAGDEVITTPLSFVASANCILYENAKPVFVDIEEKSMNMDPRFLEGAVSERSRAILPVHIFGQPCPMDEITSTARRHNLFVLEDACEAIGAEFRGKKVGSFGDAAVFAFYPNKQMTTGEGGMITTDDPDLAERLRSLRNQGRGEMGSWLDHDQLGYNYRLGEMNAALGLSQLSRIEDLLLRRQRVADYYREMLRDVPGVELMKPVETTTRQSWFVLIVRLAEKIAKAPLMKKLADLGVPSRSYFTPIHLHPFYRERFGYDVGSFPITERVARSLLALPFHTNFSKEDVEFVIGCLKQAVSAV